jgi:hypothetical protein
MINIYQLTLFVFLGTKRKKEKSTSEHWYRYHYERINISKERTKKRRLHFFFDNPMSLPIKEKTLLTYYYSFNESLLPLNKDFEDMNYLYPLHWHCHNQRRNQSPKNYYYLNLNHHQYRHYRMYLLMNSHHHTNKKFLIKNLFYLFQKINSYIICILRIIIKDIFIITYL